MSQDRYDNIMDTVIFTNILFACLSIFLIFITVGFIILIFYIVKIIKSLCYFLDILKKESERIAENFEKLIEKFRSGENVLMSSIAFIVSFLKNLAKTRKNK